MATTPCLRLAQWVPNGAAAVNDVVQVQQIAPYLATRFVSVQGLPAPLAEGDVLQANAALSWVPAPVDGGAS